ncbi:glycoside hydrolase family 113 [Gluconobacter kondonii]|uniref:glycoside hydrolase family 113 n=1 Tax=Gluconobacter kondonii TaxID=941463 RepID=UPI002012B5CD|nr:glycosidase-like protein [Gluconobacter kondonii]
MSKRLIASTFTLLLASIASGIFIRTHTIRYDTAANIKMSPNAPWGSVAALTSMKNLKNAGAKIGMIVTFTWQPDAESDTPILGQNNDPETVRKAIIDVRRAGLTPMLKIHLWIPNHWAGQINPAHPDVWFDNYWKAISSLIDLARQENVQAVIIGTEMRGVEAASGWGRLVAAARMKYAGKLVYDTDSLDQAIKFQHWNLFDAIATSLYTVLSDDSKSRRKIMVDNAEKLSALGKKWGKPVWVAELGIRSAEGLLTTPWISPEEQTPPVNLAIQNTVLHEWRDVLTSRGIKVFSIWCWYTNPREGGTRNSDFTIQNKPAQSVLKPSFF